MAVKIGIVCEGVTDYKVLKHIIERYLRDEDVYTIPLQPKKDTFGTQVGFGSWHGVLEYLSGEDKMLLEAFDEGCSYIVVHIDTDVCEEYGVSKNEENLQTLHSAVKQMLTNRVHPGFDKTKLLFAIAIHETECWLIPFLTSDKKECCRINGCVNKLNNLYKGKTFIDPKNKNQIKARKVYDAILSNVKKSKDIKAASNHNYGFNYLILFLDKIKEAIQSQQD